MMARTTQRGICILIFIVTTYLIYRLAPILTPFLLGALLAYLANPLVKLFQKFHLSHVLSVVLVFVLLISIILALLFMFVPILHKQILTIVEMAPAAILWLEDSFFPWLKQTTNLDEIKSALTNALPNIGVVVSTMLHSGFALIEVMLNLVLTPIVFFYFLRDGNKIGMKLKALLPKANRATVMKLVKECDDVLRAFFRGQLLVMLALMFIYGIGLTAVGLNVGFMIGVTGGILSIIPYMGSMFVLVASVITAFIQYGTWHAVIGVLTVFLIGQSLESYVLAPYLIGHRIGLHPVVVIFAILAGGTLFGFFGVLLALPVSAVIKVLLQFVREQYIAA